MADHRVVIYTTDPTGDECRRALAEHDGAECDCTVVDLRKARQAALKIIAEHPELILPPVLIEIDGELQPPLWT